MTPAVPHFLPGPGTTAASAAAGPSTRRGGLLDDVEAGQGQGDADPDRVKAAPKSGANRLELARWLVSTDNPLTARNFVNRLWAQFFGAGLSARLEDLGLQGEWPSHPQLLNWLAAEFMEPSVAATPVPGGRGPHAWDVKHLVRLVVNSATYRQSTEPSARAREVDPMNRLLARQSPRRLEAEIVRDQALAVADFFEPRSADPACSRTSRPGTTRTFSSRTATTGPAGRPPVSSRTLHALAADHQVYPRLVQQAQPIRNP